MKIGIKDPITVCENMKHCM